MRLHSAAIGLSLGAVLFLGGCVQIKARDLIRDGNSLYQDGQYQDAIKKYDEALELEPDGVTVLWNRACAAESLVLQLQDTGDEKQRAMRKEYADMALADFESWLSLFDGNEEELELAEKDIHDHRLALLKADERCDDLIAYWLDKLQAAPSDEGLYSVIARTYEDTCGDTAKADEWYVKRTEDFPDSPQAWYSLAVRRFDPLFPDPESGLPFNANMNADDRLKLADEVIDHLNKATKADNKKEKTDEEGSRYRDPFVWRAMAYTQKQFAREYDEESPEPEDRLLAILAREDSMLAWKEQRAVCDIDQIKPCPRMVLWSELEADPEMAGPDPIAVSGGEVVEGSVEKTGDATVEFDVVAKAPEPVEGEDPPADPPEGEDPAAEPKTFHVIYTFLPPAEDPETGEVADLAPHVDEVMAQWKKGRASTLTGTFANGVLKATEQLIVACCPLQPLTADEIDTDKKLKAELEAEIAAKAAAEAAEAAGDNKKKKKKGRKGR